MADHVNLSLWLRGYSPLAMPRYLERILAAFPFSQFQPTATLRVLAISVNEPPLLERLYEAPDLEEMVEDAKGFLNTDVAFEVECQWELWRKDPDWALKPSPVSLMVCGPEFESDNGEHVRIDAGAETLYLPEASTPQSLRPIQSNVRSLLRLAEDLGAALPVERRALWSDSGENFAERFEEAL